MMLLSDCDNIV